MIAQTAAAGALARAWPAAAQAFDASALRSAPAMMAEVARVNREMGPTRLTASAEHQRFVAYLSDELRRTLGPAGGSVFEDRFKNYPRWTPRRWGLVVGGAAIPTAGYFPYCTGGFTGARAPLEAAAALAAPGRGGGYERAGAGSTRVVEPRMHASGELVALGTFTRAGSVDWSKARGKVALVGVSVEAAGAGVPASAYRQLGLYDHGRPSSEPYRRGLNATNTILNPPDISNAARAGVEGVVLVWEGISDANAQGQYDPFPVPFGSYPPSSQAGSDPAATLGGAPVLWVTASIGAALRGRLGQRAEITLEASIEQADTATVWGWLPGESQDEILICNTHSDGPNIVEENGGLAVLHVARYFAGLPRARRRKSMVFMASTGHFGHRFLGSGRDWIVQHPQIMSRAVGCMTLEHFGCREWRDVERGGELVYAPTGRPELAQIYLTDPNWRTTDAGPPDPALAPIAAAAVQASADRAALLSGGVFFGEGGGFHAAGVPTIGYIPVPQYLCAMAPDGEISKFDPALFRAQTALAVRCFLAMQQPGYGARTAHAA
jgi:hypothetical protein